MRALFSIAVVLVLSLLTGCSQPYATNRVSRLEPRELVGFRDVCSRSGVPQDAVPWRVSPAQAAAVDRRLGQLGMLEDWKADMPPSRFYRQYLGVTVRGKRLIYINGVHPSVVQRSSPSGESYRHRWRTRAFMVCDGGRAFWGAYFNPSTRAFSGLDFNWPY